MICVKAPITGWHEVTEETARRWAAGRYYHMTCPFKLEYLNQCLLRGISFTEKELKDEWNSIRQSS